MNRNRKNCFPIIGKTRGRNFQSLETTHAFAGGSAP